MEPAYGPVEVNQTNGRVKDDKVKGGSSRAGNRKSNLMEELGADYKWESSEAYHVRMITGFFTLVLILIFLYLSEWHQYFGGYSSNVSSFLVVYAVVTIRRFFANWSTALERKKLEKELK